MYVCLLLCSGSESTGNHKITTSYYIGNTDRLKASFSVKNKNMYFHGINQAFLILISVKNKQTNQKQNMTLAEKVHCSVTLFIYFF